MVRKTVTVLFADVTGSTAIGERLDPEALRRIMTRYFEVSRATLERHGATVEKFIGDAVMAVFGVPAVHEDDALRAARAAVELRREVETLGLELRIGVNTGEVVAEEGGDARHRRRRQRRRSPRAGGCSRRDPDRRSHAPRRTRRAASRRARSDRRERQERAGSGVAALGGTRRSTRVHASPRRTLRRPGR